MEPTATIPALTRCTECGRVKRTDRLKTGSDAPEETWVKISEITRVERRQIKEAYPNIKDLRIKQTLCPECTTTRQTDHGNTNPLARLLAPLVSGARRLFSSRALTT